MPHLVSDAHERINDILTVPIYCLAKPQPTERACKKRRWKLGRCHQPKTPEVVIVARAGSFHVGHPPPPRYKLTELERLAEGSMSGERVVRRHSGPTPLRRGARHAPPPPTLSIICYPIVCSHRSLEMRRTPGRARHLPCKNCLSVFLVKAIF